MNTQQLWQAQALDAPRISLAFVLQQLDTSRRRARMHNALNYVAGVAGVAFWAWNAVKAVGTEPLLFAALGLWIAAVLMIFYFWNKRAATELQPTEFGVLDALKFHRRQLERQRDARRGAWRWSPYLFIPGHVMLFLSFFVEITPIPWRAIILTAVLIVFGTWISIVMTERDARRTQKEIDALDSL